MGFYLKAALGVALIAGGLAAAGWSIFELAQIGTCASGGPYEVARECPEGAISKAFAIFPATLAVMVGVGLFAIRGSRATNPGLPPQA